MTRSFSILQLVILVFVHKRDNIISKEKINEVLHLFLDYFDKETTYEGYKKEVGFLHSIAHSADLFLQFMTIEYFGEEELKKIFCVISQKFKLKSYYFQHDEDERMVKAIVEGLKRNLLSDKFLDNWLEELANYEKPSEYPDIYYITNNIKILLRSLYFAILDDEKMIDFNIKIREVLKNKVVL